MQYILYWLVWNTFTQKLSRCNGVPLLQDIAFYIFLLSYYFNLAKAHRAYSQKIICMLSCQKNMHILPLISISFVLNWSLYSSLALAVFWLFPRPLEYSVRFPLFNRAGFTSALVKWNTLTRDGCQTESNCNWKKRHFDKERRNEKDREMEWERMNHND